MEFAGIWNGPVRWLDHVPFAVMLVSARLGHRSLGAWPPYLSAVITALLLMATVVRASDPFFVLSDLLIGPTALIILARQQTIPGLRRGQMTSQQRAHWIAVHGLGNAKHGDRPNRLVGLATSSRGDIADQRFDSHRSHRSY